MQISDFFLPLCGGRTQYTHTHTIAQLKGGDRREREDEDRGCGARWTRDTIRQKLEVRSAPVPWRIKRRLIVWTSPYDSHTRLLVCKCEIPCFCLGLVTMELPAWFPECDAR